MSSLELVKTNRMKIVFENAHFVVVDKASGWLTIPGRFAEKDERPCLGLKLQEKMGQQIWPVHRLDFEVSGLVVFAKTAVAHKAANSVFEDRSVSKTYIALTEGALSSETIFEWRSKLLRGKKRSYEHELGKLAITKAECLGSTADGYLNWKLLPLTGRSHQLRVHLAQHGYPIVGDKLYGSTRAFNENAIALRAVKLDFTNCAELKAFDLPLVIEQEQSSEQSKDSHAV